MSGLGDSIRHNFKSLTVFSGRDSRVCFWPYAATAFVLSMMAGWVVLTPIMVGSMLRMQRFAEQHPESATVTTGPGSYSVAIQGAHPELMPDFNLFLGVVAAYAIVVIALLAAAVVRRLHDRGMSGLWGLGPIPFLAVGLGVFFRLFNSFSAPSGPDMGLLMLMFANNMIYLIVLVLLVIQLALPGTPGPNCFGAKPIP